MSRFKAQAYLIIDYLTILAVATINNE